MQEVNTQTNSIISQKNTHLKAVTAQQFTASFSQILNINPTGFILSDMQKYIIKLFIRQRVETEATYCLHLNSYTKFIRLTLNCCLLGYDTVRSSRIEMTFWRIVLPLSLQMTNEFIPKEAGFSKTLVHFYQATWSHIPEKFSQSLL